MKLLNEIYIECNTNKTEIINTQGGLMKDRIKIAILIFILLVSSIQISAQNTFNLSYKFEKGKTYFYRITSVIEKTQNMMGQETINNIVSKSKIRMEAADVNPDNFSITTSFDSIYSKSSSSMGGDDAINNGEGAIGKKTKIIFNNYGKKLKTIEIDTVKSEGGMNIFTQLTNKPLKVGEVWTNVKSDTSKMGEDGNMITKSDTECKVESKENIGGVECLKISFKGNMKIEGAMTQQEMNIVLEGTGKTTGIIYFDLAKGLMKSTDTTTETNMTAVLPEQNITIPITQKTKTNILLLEK
jgi:hypothetical protein